MGDREAELRAELENATSYEDRRRIRGELRTLQKGGDPTTKNAAVPTRKTGPSDYARRGVTSPTKLESPSPLSLKEKTPTPPPVVSPTQTSQTAIVLENNRMTSPPPRSTPERAMSPSAATGAPRSTPERAISPGAATGAAVEVAPVPVRAKPATQRGENDTESGIDMASPDLADGDSDEDEAVSEDEEIQQLEALLKTTKDFRQRRRMRQELDTLKEARDEKLKERRSRRKPKEERPRPIEEEEAKEEAAPAVEKKEEEEIVEEAEGFSEDEDIVQLEKLVKTTRDFRKKREYKKQLEELKASRDEKAAKRRIAGRLQASEDEEAQEEEAVQVVEEVEEREEDAKAASAEPEKEEAVDEEEEVEEEEEEEEEEAVGEDKKASEEPSEKERSPSKEGTASEESTPSKERTPSEESTPSEDIDRRKPFGGVQMPGVPIGIGLKPRQSGPSVPKEKETGADGGDFRNLLRKRGEKAVSPRQTGGGPVQLDFRSVLKKRGGAEPAKPAAAATLSPPVDQGKPDYRSALRNKVGSGEVGKRGGDSTHSRGGDFRGVLRKKPGSSEEDGRRSTERTSPGAAFGVHRPRKGRSQEKETEKQSPFRESSSGRKVEQTEVRKAEEEETLAAEVVAEIRKETSPAQVPKEASPPAAEIYKEASPALVVTDDREKSVTPVVADEKDGGGVDAEDGPGDDVPAVKEPSPVAVSVKKVDVEESVAEKKAEDAGTELSGGGKLEVGKGSRPSSASSVDGTKKKKTVIVKKVVKKKVVKRVVKSVSEEAKEAAKEKEVENEVSAVSSSVVVEKTAEAKEDPTGELESYEERKRKRMERRAARQRGEAVEAEATSPPVAKGSSDGGLSYAERRKARQEARKKQEEEEKERREKFKSTLNSGSDSGAKPVLAKKDSGQQQLLSWVKAKCRYYENVDVTDFSKSFSDGLAFCALAHTYIPEEIPYDDLTKEDRRQNFELAFSAFTKAGVSEMLDVEDFVAASQPDPRSVMTYLSSIYHYFK